MYHCGNMYNYIIDQNMHREIGRSTKYNVDECFNRTLKTTDELPKKSLPPPLLPATFKVVSNDHRRQSLRALLELKCIISRQLPKMPRPYIAKMLFDGRHECLLAIDPSDVMVGGVTYRCFAEKDFAEIVFLAVDTPYRDKRVGSQIMDNLKANLQKRGKRLLLTYADNTALGFFKKQGFEAVQETATCSWNGYIKTYLEGTLMECKIFEQLNYTRHKALLQQSKALIISKVNALLPTAPFKYSCKTLHGILKKHPFCDDFRFQRIPGLTEARWSTAQQHQLQQQSQFSLVLQQLFAVQSLRRVPEAAIFRGLRQLDLIDGESEELQTWSSIEKRILSGTNFQNVRQTCQAIEDMTKSYLKHLPACTPEAESVREFQKKMNGPLNALMNRQLPIKINLAFNDKQSKPKKSQFSSSRLVKK